MMIKLHSSLNYVIILAAMYVLVDCFSLNVQRTKYVKWAATKSIVTMYAKITGLIVIDSWPF